MPSARVPRVTAADVARVVGVDRSTVSLVLGGKGEGRVTPAVQEAVRRAATDLGYRPNAAARALRLGRADALALVVPQASNPFFAPLLQGAAREARRAGFAVVLVDAEDDGTDAQSRFIEVLSRQAVAGLMLWSAPSAAELVAWRGRMVLMELEAAGVASVLLDVEQGAVEAARHLLGLGHRRIARLAGDSGHGTFARRAEAVRGVLREAQLDFVASAGSAFDLCAAQGAARALLLEHAPTAIVCDDDLLAAGAYRAARSLGWRVPEDVSVVGFNDVDLARVLDPELTTVAADAAGLGTAAVRQLLALLDGSVRPATVRVPTGLVVRSSTGPPR